MRRGGRPGLIGLAARTAVVAGTVNAVSGSMQQSQHRKAQAAADQQQFAVAQQQAQMDAAAQAAVAQASAAQNAPAGPQAAGFDLVAELQKLAALKDAGVLNESEFAAAKAKILG